LQAWLLTDVDRKIGASLTREQRTNLESHLKALFAGRVVTSPFAKDDKLITQTRERLAGVPLAQRSYARLRRILLQTSPPNAFTIAEMAGAESALVIRRASGKPLTDGIPTLFTYRGYWDIFDKRMAETTLALEQEDRWVLQIRAPGMTDITSRELLLREVRRLYLTDYIRVWDEYLADVRLAESKSLLQSIQMTRVLSTGESPMSRSSAAPRARPTCCATTTRPRAACSTRRRTAWPARASASSSSSASPMAASAATPRPTAPSRWWTTTSSRCAAW
jgi:type VI secretion system protein ImpL